MNDTFTEFEPDFFCENGVLRALLSLATFSYAKEISELAQSDTAYRPQLLVILGWGCSLVDYDNDGLTDVFVCRAYGGINALYHNVGNFQFDKVTTEPMVRTYGDFGAGVFADYDNDGDLDLFVSNYPPFTNCFFRNDLGAGNSNIFTRSTTWPTAAWSVGAAWGDYDNDGFVDLVEANRGSSAQSEFVYRNDGAGGMIRISAPPLTSSGGRSQNCSWADYDGDGECSMPHWAISRISAGSQELR